VVYFFIVWNFVLQKPCAVIERKQEGFSSAKIAKDGQWRFF
jgi:hypothetical protein